MHNKLKTILVDDELNSLEALMNMIESYCPELEVVQSFQESREALNFLLKNEIDVVFLDINMPFLSGIDLVRKIPKPSFSTIFTTAFDQYAIEAIKLSAKDYLLKPIDPAELVAAVQKLESNSHFKMDYEDPTESNFKSNKLIIQQVSNAVFINHDDIIYLKADNNYTDIFTEKKFITASKTIKYFESQLPTPPFYRCHQSYVININFITEYIKTDQSIKMKNGKSVPLSKNKKEGLFKMLS